MKRYCKTGLKTMILSAALLVLILLPNIFVRADSGNLIHDDAVSMFHQWDDGLSEWQNGRSDFYYLKEDR